MVLIFVGSTAGTADASVYSYLHEHVAGSHVPTVLEHYTMEPYRTRGVREKGTPRCVDSLVRSRSGPHDAQQDVCVTICPVRTS